MTGTRGSTALARARLVRAADRPGCIRCRRYEAAITALATAMSACAQADGDYRQLRSTLAANVSTGKQTAADAAIQLDTAAHTRAAVHRHHKQIVARLLAMSNLNER